MDLARRPPRASPAGRPPPPPRVLRSSATALGMALVAALDEPPARAPAAPTTHTSTLAFLPQRPRSDSTLSSDTFDGIYALGDDDVGAVDVDDVDMDDLQCVDADADTSDAFRPSALLDRKLEDEFGRASDLERMLSALEGNSAAVDELPDVQGMEVDDDEAAAVMAHLAQLDAQHKMTKTTTTMATTLPSTLNTLLLLPNGERRVVVQSIVGAKQLMDTDEAMAALPARAAPSDTKRRVHKRTFGERAATFRFGFTSSSSSSTTSPVKVTAAASASTTMMTVCSGRSRTTYTTTARRARSLFREAAEDIAGRRDVGSERDDKENTPPAVSLSLENDGDGDDEMRANDEVEQDEESTSTTVVPESTAQTPVRSGASSTELLPATASAVPASASFHTPLRRTASSIATDASSASASAFLTPTVAVSSTASNDSSTTAHACGAISPAPTFDKVAVVHAKDTPGKVDKFEWTIRRGARPNTASSPAHTAAADLPPPYLRDATTSSAAAPKRRVHTSTFGSLARSFSFTTP